MAHRAARRLSLAVALASLASLAAAAPPAPLELAVDATQAPRGLFRARLVVPAAPGPLTLAYPKFIQGEHAAGGPIRQLAGLTVTAGGAPVPWRRDGLDPYLFHLEVPPGATALVVSLDYLSPTSVQGAVYGLTPNATSHLLVVDWHDLLLYPLGPPSDAQPVRARLTLPPGWRYDTALDAQPGPAGTVAFAPTSLTTLLDSPVLAGDLFRTELLADGPVPARLSLAADRASSLAVPPERLARYRRLVREAQALFGARHHRGYHWLVALSEGVDENGLEHHESTDIRGPPGYFTDELLRPALEYTLAHEYVHSWNGKYRRPAGLVTPDPQAPLETSLLWVYEGLTRYLEVVLAARSGMLGPEEAREYLAFRAGRQDRARPGRRWRPLVDTARSVSFLFGGSPDWTSWRRYADFYDESLLLWLEVDVLLRERSGGARSLDDFCRAFFGGEDGPPEVRPYTQADVEAALAALVPLDWHRHFLARVEALAPVAPLEGLTRSGWRLAYLRKPSGFQRSWDALGKQIDLTFSPGLLLGPGGEVKDVVLDSPAWAAGLGPGMKVLGVGGRPWSPEALEEELNAAAARRGALELLVQHGEALKTFRVTAPEGVVHPHLERDPARPDLLSAILAPRAGD